MFHVAEGPLRACAGRGLPQVEVKRAHVVLSRKNNNRHELESIRGFNLSEEEAGWIKPHVSRTYRTGTDGK